MDAFDWGTLTVLALLSCWFLVVLLRREGPDRIWTGTDGLLPGDQQQYLAWIRLAANDGLISNPYRLEPTSASFLHPGLVISGAFHALGVSPAVAYLLWKPVAVVALFASLRAYVRVLISGVWARRAALVLALFAVAPAIALGDALDLTGPTRAQLGFIAHEMWAGFWLWGYPFTTLAIAAVPAALLAYGRDRARAGSGCGHRCSPCWRRGSSRGRGRPSSASSLVPKRYGCSGRSAGTSRRSAPPRFAGWRRRSS